jgi:hypothetical protein
VLQCVDNLLHELGALLLAHDVSEYLIPTMPWDDDTIRDFSSQFVLDEVLGSDSQGARHFAVYGEIGTVLIALAGDPLTTLELIAR